jgi:GNAT superfamily N-acetyltransferase
VIRRGTAADAKAIAGVHVRGWRHAYVDLLDPQLIAERDVDLRSAQWREWIGAGEGEVWLAEVEGRVVGFAAVAGEILRALYVDPVAQGAGVGSALLARAEAVGARELEVFSGNGHARRFYEARGWREAGSAGEWLGAEARRYVR